MTATPPFSLNPREQVEFKVTEHGDGTCNVVTEKRPVEMEALLTSLGFARDAVPEVIARINLDQEVEFLNRDAVPSVLWHNPKERRVVVQARRPGPPVLCPNCDAVLKPWPEGQRQQICPRCGHTTTLS